MRNVMALILGMLLFANVAVAQMAQEKHYSQEQPKMIASYEQFKRIPILDDGRMKPLDTYARNLLLRFSGKETIEGQAAIVWFAKVLFAFDQVKENKVFLINNPDIATALSLNIDSKRRYSFEQLQKSVRKLSQLAKAARSIEPKNQSIVEQEIIRLYANVELCAGLSQVMLFTFPHPDFNGTSYLDVALQAKTLHQATAELTRKKSTEWTDQERSSLALAKSFFHWSTTYTELPLTLIPSSINPSIWLNPWEAILKDFKNEQTRALLDDWQKMTASFWVGDQVKFDMAVNHYLENIQLRLPKKEQKLLKTFSIELAYHAWMPFLWSKMLYIIAFISFMASLLSWPRFWYQIAWIAVLAGLVPHVLALAARIIIMGRPPVSSLYETFIFVALISVILGVFVERINRQWLGIIVAAISGAAFLFIAERYSTEGDTLKVLVAVLNSNFWLATHVTTITMGYAATCVAGILGHIWLIQACFVQYRPKLQNTYNVMMIMLGIALTLTFLGTNLGGIWADQSWGRFWGWDPKENGALMIVLWSAMLFHARIAKLIGPLGMAVGNALGVIVVMWAWFGVNLLSIGLHSYGFTSGIATVLMIYVACELIFLGITFYFAKKNA